MSTLKTFGLIFWVIVIVVYGSVASLVESYFRKRRALRTLQNAKFYLFSTTSTAPNATRQRDWAAQSLLTEKLFEVLNG